MIGVLIGVFIYIFVGFLIELLITKGEQKPNLVLVLAWPVLLLVCLIVLGCEGSDDTE